MEPFLKTMCFVEAKKTQQITHECSAFMDHLRHQLPSLLHPSQLHQDGALYLPIKGRCVSFVLQELEKNGIHHSNMTSSKNKCIRIALTEDHTQIHAVPLSYSCEYVKRIFNQ